MHQLVLRKSLLKGETGEGEYVVPFTARMRVEVGDQVARGAALQKVQSNQNVSLQSVMSCQLKLTFLVKYKKFTVAKGRNR